MRAPKKEGQHPASERAQNRRERSRRHWGESHGFALGLLTMAAMLAPARLPAALTAEGNGPLSRSTLTIWVFNYARVPARKLKTAESEAGRIFGGAGVETAWLDCPLTRSGSRPAQTIRQLDCSGSVVGAIVSLRILNRSNYKSTAVNQEVFGYTIEPDLASVLYDRVANLADAIDIVNQAAVILGDAMAHEIGHLLLGPNSHSPAGIMCAKWDREYLRLALMGCQRFSPEQSTRIRAAAQARMKVQSASLASRTAR
jgi:hypothetical protein